MALVITNVQNLVISLLAAGGKIACKGPITPGLRAMCKHATLLLKLLPRSGTIANELMKEQFLFLSRAL